MYINMYTCTHINIYIYILPQYWMVKPVFPCRNLHTRLHRGFSVARRGTLKSRKVRNAVKGPPCPSGDVKTCRFHGASREAQNKGHTGWLWLVHRDP